MMNSALLRTIWAAFFSIPILWIPPVIGADIFSFQGTLLDIRHGYHGAPVRTNTLRCSGMVRSDAYRFRIIPVDDEDGHENEVGWDGRALYTILRSPDPYPAGPRKEVKANIEATVVPRLSLLRVQALALAMAPTNVLVDSLQGHGAPIFLSYGEYMPEQYNHYQIRFRRALGALESIRAFATNFIWHPRKKDFVAVPLDPPYENGFEYWSINFSHYDLQAKRPRQFVFKRYFMKPEELRPMDAKDLLTQRTERGTLSFLPAAENTVIFRPRIHSPTLSAGDYRFMREVNPHPRRGEIEGLVHTMKAGRSWYVDPERLPKLIASFRLANQRRHEAVQNRTGHLLFVVVCAFLFLTPPILLWRRRNIRRKTEAR